MTIDKEIYKEIEIEIHYNEKTKCFSALSKLGNSSNKYDNKLGNFCMGYATPTEAVFDVKEKIDNFLKYTPKNHKEFAEAITGSLVWTGYEDCHVNEQVLEILLNNFIKLKQK